MAITVLPKQRSLAESLGTGIAGGLGEALQGLAQNKIQQLQQQSTMKGLESLGFTPDQASSIAGLPPELQQMAVKQQLAAPHQQAYAQALSQLLGGGENPTASISQSSPSTPGSVDVRAMPPGLNERQATELTKLALKERAAERKESAAEKREAYKQTKTERKEILDKAKAARQNLHDLKRLEELGEEGLISAGYNEFLNRSGFDIPALTNPASEEFQKIQANFSRDAKSIFGSRVTNYELEQFLKSIPSLSQSPEGRKRVIANLKYLNRVSLKYNQAMKEVIDENKGVPPLDLLEKVDSKIEPYIDKVAEKFKKDVAKPVPAGQSKLATALQAGLGSLVGAPGKILGAAGRLGSVLGAL